ncbi:sensor histidine kinase [Olivibacter sp. CPCC 100613]|uniref:tetratricopeptide repeat-containing sensor histidine kinase n=1 Tax=Olivibacter sp. CPCC 100613 TaxID=3079931 RepID=UPI002FF7C1FF
MKHICFWLLFFLCFPFVKAQYIPLDRKRHADSLEHALKTDPSDSLKARAAYLLSEYWAKQDTAKAKPYLAKGKVLAGNSPYARALYHYYIGQLYFKTQALRSEEAYLTADSIIVANNLHYQSAYALLAAIWYNYCVLLQLKDDTEGMVNTLLDKVVVYTRNAGRYEQLPDLYATIGVIFDNEQEFEQAAPHFKQALSMLDTIPLNKPQKAYIFSSAVHNFLARNKLTEANVYQERVKELLQHFHHSEYYMEYLLNEANYLCKTKQYNAALQYVKNGIALAKRIAASPYETERFQEIQAEILAKQGKHTEAKNLLLTMSQHPTTPFATTRMYYYQQLAEQFAKLGDFKQAYYWNQRFTSVNDSLNSAKLKERIFHLETKFRTAESKLEINALKAQQAEAALQAKNSKLFIWILGLACLVFILLTTISRIYYQSKQRLAAQEALKQQEKLIALEQQREIGITKAVLEGEERERTRIARELHDGLGGTLASVKINLSAWATNMTLIPEEDAFGHVVKQLDRSIGELRRIARNLMPEVLLKLGFEAALNDLCLFFTNKETQVRFQPYGLQEDNTLQLQTAIYRIVQELLTNAIRHGHAKQVLVQCSQLAHHFVITVEDNGIGFNQTMANGKEGMGLTNIKNRVAYFKGKLELISSPGQGTSVHIEMQEQENLAGIHEANK